MVAGESGCGELRSAGSGRALSALRLSLLAAAVALAGCTRSVMVQPADESAPPPVHRPTPSATAGDSYTVQPGDTLYKISLQYGVDYRDLAAWNGIEAPYTIYPKQRLRVSERKAPAASPARPAASATATAVAAAPPPANAERVGAAATPAATAGAPAAASRPAPGPGYDPNLGVTLPEGAQPISAGPSTASTSAAPVFEPDAPLPTVAAGAAATTQPARPAAATTPATTTAAPTPAPANPPTAPATVTAPSTAAPVTGATDIAGSKPSAAGWIWPTPGKVVGTYAAGDPTRQGIDIAGEAGQPVRAARDGEVVYSGAGLIGYGELIIVKHSPELLSAYGHNRVRLVKEGDKVKSGQKIAEMGKNAANRVLLHFEVRKNGKPVDPLPLLPAR